MTLVRDLSQGGGEPVVLDGVRATDVLLAIRQTIDLAYLTHGDLARVSLPATFVDWLWQQHASLTKQCIDQGRRLKDQKKAIAGERKAKERLQAELRGRRA